MKTTREVFFEAPVKASHHSSESTLLERLSAVVPSSTTHRRNRKQKTRYDHGRLSPLREMPQQAPKVFADWRLRNADTARVRWTSAPLHPRWSSPSTWNVTTNKNETSEQVGPVSVRFLTDAAYLASRIFRGGRHLEREKVLSLGGGYLFHASVLWRKSFVCASMERSHRAAFFASNPMSSAI